MRNIVWWELGFSDKNLKKVAFFSGIKGDTDIGGHNTNTETNRVVWGDII